MIIFWEFIFCIFDIVLLNQFLNIYLRIKKKNIFSLIFVYFFMALLILSVSYYDIISFNSTILIFLVFFSFSILLFNDSLKKKAIIVFVFYAIYGLYTLIALNLTSLFLSKTIINIFSYQNELRIVFTISSRILLFLFFNIFRRNISKNRHYHQQILTNLIPYLFFGSVLSLVLFKIVAQKINEQTDFLFLFLSFIFLGYNFYKLYSIEIKNKLISNNENIESEMSIFGLSAEERSNEQSENIKIIKHDYKNHLLSISYLLAEESIDEAKSYLQSLVTHPAFKKNINTNNIVLNNILNNLIEMNPKIHFDIILDVEEFNLPSSDLTSLLCNSIDNAVEAVTSNPLDKKIYIYLKETDQALMIEVKNHFQTEIIKFNNVLQTTKLDSTLHGFGMISIEKTVNKYGGKLLIEINEEEKFFILIIILHKNTIQSIISAL